MLFKTLLCARPAALIVLALSTGATGAHADIKDYDFQLVEKETKKGEGIVAVRLVRKSDGKPVPDAVIFATRLDMEPDGMETMKTSIEPMPSTEPGVYRFKVNLIMEGGWRLSLGAKVQGEVDSLESRLVLKALP
ncbi:MAG: FixH family protein [Bosea sp.]|uniref:FixH family protein n=1 Tax=Bosea sp. (in: a-proteobacteria) TaxID=1871050 RepID=UPI0023A2B7EA|nr:FixH family protein [Bosea sp. (in: a-proteobacteria)]MCP4739949.1 FixH family protein [Bosea sp. (in: a-proteobacteria)]